MFWMRAYPLRGQVGEGWALEIEATDRAMRAVGFAFLIATKSSMCGGPRSWGSFRTGKG